jgi:hypothetical protein
MELLDPAAIRRFSFKISFSYAEEEQVEALYRSLLAPLVKGEIPESVKNRLFRLARLTPGDFHVVKSQFWLAESETTTHEQLVESLAAEQNRKLERRQVGF